MASSSRAWCVSSACIGSSLSDPSVDICRKRFIRSSTLIAEVDIYIGFPISDKALLLQLTDDNRLMVQSTFHTGKCFYRSNVCCHLAGGGNRLSVRSCDNPHVGVHVRGNLPSPGAATAFPAYLAGSPSPFQLTCTSVDFGDIVDHRHREVGVISDSLTSSSAISLHM